MRLTRTALVIGVLALAGCASSRPADGGSPGPTGSRAGAEVTGTVTATPACPGPVRADSPCPSRPVAGARVELASAGTVVAQTTADGAGRFRFEVAPGQYRLTAHNVGYPSQSSQEITVATTLDVTIVVDSGIR